MRFNKTIFVFSLACLNLAPLLPTAASQPAENKNQGRKLSMTLPGLGTAQIVVTPAKAANTNIKSSAINKSLPDAHLPAVKQVNGNNITVRVPSTVDEAITNAQSMGRQLGRYANSGMHGASRFLAMIAIYIRQWTGATTVTPSGSPYCDTITGPLPATTAASGHKLYYTASGRVKSVVER